MNVGGWVLRPQRACLALDAVQRWTNAGMPLDQAVDKAAMYGLDAAEITALLAAEKDTKNACN